MERGVESVGREDEGGDEGKGKEAGYVYRSETEGWEERGGEGVWRRGCVEERRMGGNGVRLVCSCTR